MSDSSDSKSSTQGDPIGHIPAWSREEGLIGPLLAYCRRPAKATTLGTSERRPAPSQHTPTVCQTFWIYSGSAWHAQDFSQPTGKLTDNSK
jgi:hypothetical protein